jgi:hypothetical protein
MRQRLAAMRFAAFQGDRHTFDRLARPVPAGRVALTWKAGATRAHLGLPAPDPNPRDRPDRYIDHDPDYIDPSDYFDPPTHTNHPEEQS